MKLIFPIYGPKKENIPISEVRLELRKIEEYFFCKILTKSTLTDLNNRLNTFINRPYNLMIKAKIVNNEIKLYGLNNDSKAVLDSNCTIKHISKKRNQNGRQTN